MASLDTSIANTALPTIAIDVQASPAASVWVVNAYQLALVATLLPLSTLGEIHGFRRVYLWGLGLFTVASLLCAMSWSLPTLTVARVLQGMGAAGIMSVNTALIRFIYPAKQLGRGVGFNAMVVGVGTALGPSIAPVCSRSGVADAVRCQRAGRYRGDGTGHAGVANTPLSSHRFDWQSGVLNAVFFGALIFMIGEAAHRASTVQTVALLVVVIVAGTALVRRQLHLPVPLLPIDLYRRPMFALSSLTSMCSFAAQGLSFVSLPFLFQMGMGRSAVETGLLLTPWPVATALMAPVAGAAIGPVPSGDPGAGSGWRCWRQDWR